MFFRKPSGSFLFGIPFDIFNDDNGKLQGNLLRGIVNCTWTVGLYQTSLQIWKSDQFSKSGLFGNWTFSFPDARLSALLQKDFFFFNFKKKFKTSKKIYLLFKLNMCPGTNVKKHMSIFNLVWQNLSVLVSGQETHMPSPVEP